MPAGSQTEVAVRIAARAANGSESVGKESGGDVAAPAVVAQQYIVTMK